MIITDMKTSSGNSKQLIKTKAGYQLQRVIFMRNEINNKRRVPVTSGNQAVFPYGTYGFPCELYYDNIDDFAGGTVEWHWQLELEFAVVLKGSIELTVQNDVITVHENEGYIIFPNKLHKVKKNGGQCGLYRTVIISPQLIYGDSRSILFHKYYLAVIDAVSNGFILLNRENSFGNNILDELAAAIQLLTRPSLNYELEIHRRFVNIWSILYGGVQDAHERSPRVSSKDENLTNKILSFIHTNYKYDISLDDIARSGSISKSECSRLFQRTLSCTPFEYLTNYRILKSQEYLSGGDYSITDIAGLVGFNSVNYYTTVFRKNLGFTPSQYKKQLKLSFAQM